VTKVAMEEFFGGATRALVDAQLELDERGRDSIDAFDDNGVPPTAFAWARCRLSCPVAVGVIPRESPAARTSATLAPRGAGTIALAFRHLGSPQGVDDPAPVLPDENPSDSDRARRPGRRG
jgi:hypothetical protein